MKHKIKLRRGDEVRVIAGKYKGSEGKIMKIFPETNRVVVENVNMVKKAQRPTQQNPRGGFDEREAGIHLSNVQLLDPKTGQPTRIGTRLEQGRKRRVASKSGTLLDD
jgi:large subunit ribosomal protein L24